MPVDLYTDRRDGSRPRTVDRLDRQAWQAFASLIRSRLSRHAFGHSFPENCEDTGARYGCNETAFFGALNGIVRGGPDLLNPDQGIPAWSDASDEPPTDAILDALEWCAGKIGEPTVIKHHGYLGHDHLHWDRAEGLRLFASEVNQIFARNSLAFEMDRSGKIRRLVERPVADALARAMFQTGDPEADALLETARTRFFDRDADAGQNALETLWDAFERIKTLEDRGKKAGAERLIVRAARNDAENKMLEDEMDSLTLIGNTWRIRHHETGVQGLGDGRDLRDYLFGRMFALIHLLLSRTGRLSIPV